MGNTLDKIEGEVFDVESLPIEIIEHIFSFVDCETQVFTCRYVCKTWNEIITEKSLRDKAALMKIIPKSVPKLPWYFYYHACEKKIFERNLLVNPCGEDNFAGWLRDHQGYSDSWKVECPPVGCSSIPDEALSEAGIPKEKVLPCFATTYTACKKMQIIRLDKNVKQIIDEMQPPIEVSEWYAPRFDCGSIYQLKVELLGVKMNVIDTFSFEITLEAWTEAIWTKVKHEFKNYGRGVHFIRFYHMGKDTQFWAGHYGSKMTLGCVRLLNPYKPQQ